jgi:hypothetical protein
MLSTIDAALEAGASSITIQTSTVIVDGRRLRPG